jgi:hypothetical protein
MALALAQHSGPPGLRLPGRLPAAASEPETRDPPASPPPALVGLGLAAAAAVRPSAGDAAAAASSPAARARRRGRAAAGGRRGLDSEPEPLRRHWHAGGPTQPPAGGRPAHRRPGQVSPRPAGPGPGPVLQNSAQAPTARLGHGHGRPVPAAAARPRRPGRASLSIFKIRRSFRLGGSVDGDRDAATPSGWRQSEATSVRVSSHGSGSQAH